jgi:hypothetical protein
LIQQELDRRLAAARSSDPTKQREQSLRRELTRFGKSLERLAGSLHLGTVLLRPSRTYRPAEHCDIRQMGFLALSDQTSRYLGVDPLS